MIALKRALFVCMLAFTTQALATDEVTLDSLRTMTQDELDALYLDAEPGPIPHGESEGTAVFFPGSVINGPTQMLAHLAWQGKVFDTEELVLLNKVFGFRLIKARVYYGKSLMDGNDSIIIDYSRTSLLAHKIRDEIRLVAPGLYLGRAYWRGLLDDYMIVNFILQFPTQY